MTGCGDPGHSAKKAALDTLETYLYDIDQSDYDSAYAQLDPRSHPLSQRDDFIEGVKSSRDFVVQGDFEPVRLFDLIGAERSGDAFNAEVHFRSEQDAAHGPVGLTGVDGHLDYSFSHVAGLWLIRKTTAVDGQPKYTACS